jgi:hypothetical protein
MPTYAEIRQRVLATLAPGVEAQPVLWGLAYAALQGGVQGRRWICSPPAGWLHLEGGHEGRWAPGVGKITPHLTPGTLCIKG